MEIVVHPARCQPRKSWLLRAYLALLALLLGRFLVGEGPPWAIGAAAALLWLGLFFTLRRWFWPTRFRFADDGVDVEFMGRTTRYPWSRFHSFEVERRGLFLSPSSSPRRFDRWRGLYVYFRDFVVSVDGQPPNERFASRLEKLVSEHVRF